MKKNQILTLQKFIEKIKLRFKIKIKYDLIISFQNTYLVIAINLE